MIQVHHQTPTTSMFHKHDGTSRKPRVIEAAHKTKQWPVSFSKLSKLGMFVTLGWHSMSMQHASQGDLSSPFFSFGDSWALASGCIARCTNFCILSWPQSRVEKWQCMVMPCTHWVLLAIPSANQLHFFGSVRVLLPQVLVLRHGLLSPEIEPSKFIMG